MTGYITVCFSNQSSDVFMRAPMKIKEGKRTEDLIRRSLRKDEKEGIDYYIKADPNFDDYTYSVCHKLLRKVLKPGDILFFRTLWRGKQYLIGYFDIYSKLNHGDESICYGHPRKSLLIPGYKYVITPDLVQRLNPNADFSRNVNENRLISSYLSRFYIRLGEGNTEFLKSELDKCRC